MEQYEFNTRLLGLLDELVKDLSGHINIEREYFRHQLDLLQSELDRGRENA
jgi:hypothetical protein